MKISMSIVYKTGSLGPYRTRALVQLSWCVLPYMVTLFLWRPFVSTFLQEDMDKIHFTAAKQVERRMKWVHLSFALIVDACFMGMDQYFYHFEESLSTIYIQMYR